MFEESPAGAQIKTEEPCSLYVLERPSFEKIAAAFPGILETIRANMIAIRQERIVPSVPKRDDT